MHLVGFQHEPVSLDVNKVCFDEKLNIPDTDEKSRKRHCATELYSPGK